VSSTGIPGLVLAHPIPSRLITVYHQQEQQRTTKEYPLGVQTPNSQYISGCIYMDGCFPFGLAGQYLIPLIERLICHLCFDLFIFYNNCIAWLFCMANDRF
jgi:hypothetical protein